MVMMVVGLSSLLLVYFLACLFWGELGKGEVEVGERG